MQSWLQRMSFALTVLLSMRASAMPGPGSRAHKASGLTHAARAGAPGLQVRARVPLLTAGALLHRRPAGEVSWKAKPSGRRSAPPLLAHAAPPTIELEHLTTHATYRLRPDSQRGGFSAAKLRALAQLLRCHHTGKRHSISERLIQILYATARHYHNAKLRIIAGYRAPQIARQKGNPRSPHKRGVACDFQVAGVTNEEVRDYLQKTYPKIGLGYYPHAGFIHVDVGRTRGAYWIDYSRPGERARYDRDDRDDRTDRTEKTEPAAAQSAAVARSELDAPAEDEQGSDAVVGLAGASGRTEPALQPERAPAADSRPASAAAAEAADTL